MNKNYKGEIMPIGNRKLRSSYPRFWVHGKHTNVFVAGRQKKKLPPLDILKWLFRYDSDTGKLYKIRGSSGRLWEPEREITAVQNGYLQVSIRDSNGLEKLFLVHHICYYIVSGVEPLQVVDHINGITTDNQFSNLRLATDSLNQRNRGMNSNNTSGVTGVYWNKRVNKWVSRAYDNSGKQKYLGSYEDKEEAARVVSAFYANPENGYSERHGL